MRRLLGLFYPEKPKWWAPAMAPLPGLCRCVRHTGEAGGGSAGGEEP